MMSTAQQVLTNLLGYIKSTDNKEGVTTLKSMAKYNETRVSFMGIVDGKEKVIVYPEGKFDKYCEGLKTQNDGIEAAAQAAGVEVDQSKLVVLPQIIRTQSFTFSYIDPEVDFIGLDEAEGDTDEQKAEKLQKKWDISFKIAQETSATPENFAGLWSRGAILVQQKEAADLLVADDFQPIEGNYDLAYSVAEKRERRKADPIGKSVKTLVESLNAGTMNAEMIAQLRAALAAIEEPPAAA
jgi:hypothetical protein